MQSFINAYFTSRKLAEKIKKIKKDSMLHFIFNEKFICVLITYDIEIGEFVLQIPFFPKIGEKENYNKILCENVLRQLISKGFNKNNNSNSIDIDNSIDDIEIINVNFWKMKNVVADLWYKDQCFIIGDAAHQFPPSGGYGMNTGISDAFSLFWRIENLLKIEENEENNNEIFKEILKEEFNRERLLHSQVKFFYYLNIFLIFYLVYFQMR